MQNLIEFREGADFVGTTDDHYETKITSGQGWAYGAELFVQKKTGRTTGWLGYTLAWSNCRFADLNQGQTYPYKYDRRHDLKLVVIHEFSPTLTLSGTFVYGTGNAITLAQGRFALGPGEVYDDYGARNSYRMAAYHRLDLDLSHTKKKRWGEVVNSLSIYNAYNRHNPYYIYLGRAAGFLEVTVSSITAEAYNFYLSRRRYFDSQNNPFAEPAPLAGNVRSGYGLLDGAADATYRIPL